MNTINVKVRDTILLALPDFFLGSIINPHVDFNINNFIIEESTGNIIVKRKVNKGVEYYTLSSLMSVKDNKLLLVEARSALLIEYNSDYDKQRYNECKKRLNKIYKKIDFSVNPCGYGYK